LLRVLHIINDLRVGGAEVLLRDLAPRLRDAGIEAEVVALAPSDSFVAAEVRTAGVPLHAHPDGIGFYSGRHATLLADRMRGFDVAHVHLFPAQWWAAVAAARLPRTERPVLVTTEHNTHNRRRKAPLRALDAWMYGRYAAVVAISPATAEALNAWVPSTRAKTRVIPNGIDLARFTAGEDEGDARPDGLPDDARPLAISVGRLEPQKDVPTLLRAVGAVGGLHLALVGDGPLRGELESEARGLGIAERVHFLGRRPDVPALLRAADVYVQSSAWEGFGLAAVEAMASGLPLVVSDVPGLREVVGDEAGLRFPAGSPADLAAALRRLLSYPAESRARAEAGRRRAATFSVEACAEAHRRLYEEVAAYGRRGPRPTTSSAR
jgi:glycosyltransferase involved in cell wall biosynthesis